MTAARIPLEGENDIDRVLQRAGPREIPVLGHVSGQEHGDSFRFRQPYECVRAPPNLPRTAHDPRGIRVPNGLYRVDREQEGSFCARCTDDVAEVASGYEGKRSVVNTNALRAVGYLLSRFLARSDQAGPSGSRQTGDQLKQEGGLADARLAGEQDDRAGDDPLAKDPVYPFESGVDPFGWVTGNERS